MMSSMISDYCMTIYVICKQVKCFNAPLQPSEITGVKRVVEEKLPEGVNGRGLTLRGFLFLHALFIEKGRLETTWTVLRKFGYNNEIRLDEDFLPPSFKQAPDQVNSLSSFLYWLKLQNHTVVSHSLYRPCSCHFTVIIVAS